MPDFFDRVVEGSGEDQQEMGPEELVIRGFSRCSNYPKERLGVLGLAQALKSASDRFGVSMERIVRECAEASTFCPTDLDLISVARGLQPAKPASESGRRCAQGICDGSGWRETFNLHTHHSGDGERPAWVTKEPITREQYDDLSRKVDWKTQMVFTGRFRCSCHPPRAEDIEKKGRYA